MRLQGHKYQQKQLACLGSHSGEPWPSPATRHAHVASRIPGGGRARADGFWVGPGAGDAGGGGKLPTPPLKMHRGPLHVEQETRSALVALEGKSRAANEQRPPGSEAAPWTWVSA